MADLSVPAGTCRIEVRGEPRSEEDVKVILWAIDISYSLGDPSMYAEIGAMRHNLPYEGGGCLLTVESMHIYEAQRRTALEAAYSPEDYERPWASRTQEVNQFGPYTGWILTDGYSDSMTHRYWSPIFVDRKPVHMPYITWEM